MTGAGFYFLSMISLLFAGSWLQAVGSVVLFGLGHGLMVPSVQNLLVSFTTIKERAAFMSFKQHGFAHWSNHWPIAGRYLLHYWQPSGSIYGRSLGSPDHAFGNRRNGTKHQTNQLAIVNPRALTILLSNVQ